MAAPTASPVFGMAGPMEALTAKVSVSEAGLMVARMAGLMVAPTAERTVGLMVAPTAEQTVGLMVAPTAEQTAAPTVEQTAEQTVAQTVEPTAVPADKDKQKRAG
jgi:hypothetical protein